MLPITLARGRDPWVPNAFYHEAVSAAQRIRIADAPLERWLAELRRRRVTTDEGPAQTVGRAGAS